MEIYSWTKSFFTFCSHSNVNQTHAVSEFSKGITILFLFIMSNYSLNLERNFGVNLNFTWWSYKTHDCKRNLSLVTLNGNQIVCSWNKDIISRVFCQNSNHFSCSKVREFPRILTNSTWNYFLISLVAIWLSILIRHTSHQNT